MKFQRKTDVVARSVAGAHLLIPVRGSARSIFTLNETGYSLWELIAEPKSAHELSVALADRYRIALEQSERDVKAFLSEMEHKDLIERMETVD